MLLPRNASSKRPRTPNAAGVFGSGGGSSYQTYWDWLYADLNNNGMRDFGPAAGFTESDPTYGEPLFIALDDNHNGRIEPWEKLVALGADITRCSE